MKVAIIGCGLIGRKRAAALSTDCQSKLVIVADIDAPRAEQLAHEYGCEGTTDWRQAVNHPHVEAVVVSTVNKFLMPITVAALERGKHVLVEKPMARNLAEAEAAYGRWQMADSAISYQQSAIGCQRSVLAVGFNHRHHPAIWKAHELCESGAIGPLMFIRCVYGHGGRPGYDKEWRADADLAGGGELSDQGVHVIDLCRWFLGEFSEVMGQTGTYFWNLGYFEEAIGYQPSAISYQLEDNAFAMLRTASGQVATFHTSWTQWKNRFTFEVFGRDGYVIVDGLGGSYGVERLKVGKRKLEGGVPEELVFEFEEPDLSWQAEWEEFTTAIRENRQPLANGEDGLQAMRIIDVLYESARTGRAVRLEARGQRSEVGNRK